MRLHAGRLSVLRKGDIGVDAVRHPVEIHMGNGNGRIVQEVMTAEDIQDLARLQLLVLPVGDRLAQIAQVLPHTGGKHVTVSLLQQISDAALAALGVDPDHVGVVGAVDIVRVDRNIGHAPALQLFFLPVLHALGDSVLMTARESGKHQRTGIGRTGVHVHPGALFVHLRKVRHIRKIKLRIHAVGIHIHGKRDDIHVSGALSVAEKRSLHPVGTGKKRKLGIGNAGTSVVVRVKRKGNKFPVLEVFAHVLHLRRIDVRQAHFHRDRQIDDYVVVGGRLQHVQHGVADLQRILRLGSGKALGGILKAEIALVLLRQLFDKLCAVHGNFLDLLPALAEHLLPLCHADRIVKVDNGGGSALASLKGLADDVLPALGQHLYRHVVGNHVLFDQRAEKLVLGLARRRKAHLDLLEAYRKQQAIEFQLFLKVHRDHQALVAVPHIHTAPDRRLFYFFPGDPPVMNAGGGIIPGTVFFRVHHNFSSSFCKMVVRVLLPKAHSSAIASISTSAPFGS